MSKTTLRGGLVGCGSVAIRVHMPVLRSMTNVEIAAVCDPNEDAAVATARRFSVPGTYRDLSQMLQREKLDFVAICTPPATHLELAIRSMEAGLHVFMEKPLASTLGEADEMVSASKKYNVKLCVAHNMLYSPVVRKARSLIANGAVGDLTAVEIESLDRRTGKLSERDHWFHNLTGGILGEYLPHPVYLILDLLGSIGNVKATGRKFSEFEWVAVDHLNVLFDGENGAGALTMSFNSPRYSFRTRIIGTEGLLEIDNCALTIIRGKHRGVRFPELILERLNLSYQMMTGAASSAIWALAGRRFYRDGHRILIPQFVRCIREDLKPPVTGEDGRETIRVIEEIWRQIGITTRG